MDRFFDWVERVLEPWADRLSRNPYMVVFQNSFFRLLPFMLTMAVLAAVQELFLNPYGPLLGPDGLGLGAVLTDGLQGEDYRSSALVETLERYSQVVQIGFGFTGLLMTMSLARPLAELWGGDPGIATFCALAGHTILTASPGGTAGSVAIGSFWTAALSAVVAARVFSRLSRIHFLHWGENGLLAPRVEKYIRLFPAVLITMLLFLLMAAVRREAEPFFASLLSSFNPEHSANLLRLAVFYQFFKSVFWWFGLHGDMFMSPLLRAVYSPAQMANQAGEAEYVFTNVFFNATTIHLWGLAIAILVFARNEDRRSVIKFCLPTLVFNMQEVIVFGLPVMFNPILLLPYLLAPLANVLTGWLAISAGIVSVFKFDLPWMAPPILCGTLSTGSFMGGVLQAVWLILDILIYAPFVIVANMVKARAGEKEGDQ